MTHGQLGSTAAAALSLLVVLQPVWAQRPPPKLPVFGHTLHQGTGYIATPHAMVSQGAFYVTATAIAPDEHIAFEGAPPGSYTLTRGAIGLALNGWIEVGGTIHRADAYTAFGKLQLIKQQGVFPAIAAGVHNLKLADDIGRYGIEDVYLSLPAVIGREGVERVLHLPLSEQETADLLRSAALLGDWLDQLGMR